jgi:hypothetical protein
VLHWLLNAAETQQQRHSETEWNKEKRKTNSTKSKITEVRILGNEQWFFIIAFKKRFQMEMVLESNPWNETIRPTAVICLLYPSFWTQRILPLPLHTHQDYKSFSLIVWQLDELPCCHHVVGPRFIFRIHCVIVETQIVIIVGKKLLRGL